MVLDSSFRTRHPVPAAVATLFALVLAGCGGGGSDAAGDVSADPAGVRAPAPAPKPAPAPAPVTAQSPAPAPAPATRQDAYRLLTQATFGPTDSGIAQVMSSGVAPWVDAQLSAASSAAYQARWDADNRLAQAKDPNANANPTSVVSQFYLHALKNDDQLRQRVAFALSQVFVVSMVDLKGAHSRAAAAYMDLLNRDAFVNYRTLLQDVTLSPAMGMYLNMLHNTAGNPATGQVPDQNYAREVMQLFSIGLSQLNADGTKKLDGSGNPVDTYGPDDVAGLSAALTGWSWSGPDQSLARFNGASNAQDPARLVTPMQAYPKYHATTEKRFLGAVVATQATPAPDVSLKTALDTIANHPNVGPFIGRQLIQRLVTSHPSDAYVGRVAAVFNDNGLHVRGDLKAVVRAILLDPEARDNTLAASGDAFGKVREPVLRLTAWMRAFNATTDSGQALIVGTDDPGLELGQSPLRSPSVFNFFRPGFVAAGTLTGARNLTMPELQITSETSVAGYANYMAVAVARGVGLRGLNGTGTRPDVQGTYTTELANAANSTTLVDGVTAKLLGDGASATLKSELRAAVDSITIPALKAGNGNLAQVNAAKQNRVNAAVLLTLASPEFIVQK